MMNIKLILIIMKIAYNRHLMRHMVFKHLLVVLKFADHILLNKKLNYVVKC